MELNDIIEAYQEILDDNQYFSDRQCLKINEDGRIVACLRNYNWYISKHRIKDPLTLVKAIFEIDWLCVYDEDEDNVFFSKYWERY